ncbi:MAG: signal peptidase I, partial [Clostridia bacterium]|nr:signal peptidase I [Clostridia bacterium]
MEEKQQMDTNQATETPKSENSGFKKILNVVKSVIVYAVLVICVGMMIFTLISVNTFNKNDKNLFGYKFFVVQTDSMSATHFNAGDVIISKEVDITTLVEGDVITFISQNRSSMGETITHRIREVRYDDNGVLEGFVTYGTTTDTNDEALATMVIGKYQARIPFLGYFFTFLKTTPGYIVCILVPFLLLMLSQGVNCVRLFKRYRAEQMEGLKNERAQLENEREESRKMMEELMALKQELANKESEQAAKLEQTVKPMVEEPKVEEVKTEEEIKSEEPVVEEIKTEEVKAEEPVVEEIKTEEVKAE